MDIILDDEDETPVTIPTVAVKKVNYLNNKDMLKEIHQSKTSFCEFIDRAKYHEYDAIVKDIADIFTPEVQEQAKAARAARIAATAFEAAMQATTSTLKADKPKLSEFKIKPDTISVDDLVIHFQ